MDIGIVPGEIGILSEHREVTGTPPGVIGPTWASREKREGTRRGPRPKPFVQVGLGLGGARATSWLLPLLPTKAR